MKQEMKNKLVLSGKLAACGATIFAIGFALLTFGPKGEVQESQADVWDFAIFERTSTAKFATSLERLGHEPPRAYDVNGNKVFFSVRSVERKRPLELVEEYQRTFVEEGLNTEQYGRPTKGGEFAKRLMGGQIVPITMTRDKVVMGGGVVQGSPQSVQEWEDLKADTKTRNINEVFRGYRHITAEWDSDAKRTMVTASWSDEDFDMRRISGASPNPQDVDPDIPVCIGCKRAIAWETEKGDIPSKTAVFMAPLDSRNVADFYKKAMAEKGWKLSSTNQYEQRSEGPLAFEFVRGEKHMHLSVVPTDSRHSRVSAYVSQ